MNIPKSLSDSNGCEACGFRFSFYRQRDKELAALNMNYIYIYMCSIYIHVTALCAIVWSASFDLDEMQI